MEPGSLPVQSSLWTARCRAVRCGLPGAGPLHGWRGRVWRRAVSHRPRTISPLLGLAPGGGYLAVRIAANAGGLLRHLFTITTRVAVCFCGPFPAGSRLSAVSPPRVLSDAVLYGVRTVLDPVNAGPRLPDQPEGFHHNRFLGILYSNRAAVFSAADYMDSHAKILQTHLILSEKVDILRKDIKI